MRCLRVILALLLLSVVAAGSVQGGKRRPFTLFERKAVGHSWPNTYLLGLASHFAYRNRSQRAAGSTMEEKFRTTYAPLGLKVELYYRSRSPRTDTQVLVLSNRSLLLVAFGGSETHAAGAAWRDWVRTDTHIKLHPLGEVSVHAGFYRALAEVYPEVVATIRDTRHRRKLWLTGHSLGGALANLAAYRLSEEGLPVAGIVTFASPKVGDRAFVRDFETRFGERSQQWSTDLDPITRLPNRVVGPRYAKLGVTNVVDADGNVELMTVQRMSTVPNPRAHVMKAYLNYLYRALPVRLRQRLPLPPPLCATGTVWVGEHPEDGLPLCQRRFASKLSRRQCLAGDREIVDDWCVRWRPGKLRYSARRLSRP